MSLYFYRNARASLNLFMLKILDKQWRGHNNEWSVALKARVRISNGLSSLFRNKWKPYAYRFTSRHTRPTLLQVIFESKGAWNKDTIIKYSLASNLVTRYHNIYWVSLKTMNWWSVSLLVAEPWQLGQSGNFTSFTILSHEYQ